MLQSIRVIYEDGVLRPLDPIHLEDGQTANVTIETEDLPDEITPDMVDERLRAAGLLVEIDVPENAQELTRTERLRIGQLFVGDQPSETLIDEERGLY
jgi:predicted DNA-binding antitoxin AbrB/MazE fold protein